MRHSLGLVALVCVGVVACAWGKPPTDGQILEAAREFRQSLLQEPHADARRLERQQELARTALGAISWNDLSPLQLVTLQRHGLLIGELRQEAIRRLESLPETTDRDGAIVAVMRLCLLTPPAPTTDAERALRARLLKNVLEHRSLRAAIRNGGAAPLYSAISQYSVAEIHAANWWSVLDDMSASLMWGASSWNADGLAGYWGTIRLLIRESSKGHRDVQSMLRKFGRRALAEAKDDPLLFSPDVLESIRAAVEQLEDTSEFGRLVGQKAPPLDIVWASDGAPQNLDDLRGQVVVLVFWHANPPADTADAESVALFRRRMADFQPQVTVLGVVGTRDSGPNPAANLAMARESIAAQGITWPMVVTTQLMLNPDYDVLRLPHITIIDSHGTVRYNALSLLSKAHRVISRVQELADELQSPNAQNTPQRR